MTHQTEYILTMYTESSGDYGPKCSETYTVNERRTILTVLECTASLSIIMGIVAILLLLYLRFHKLFTYRLAMYQVLSAVMFSFTFCFAFSSMFYSGNRPPYVIICKIQAFFAEYFIWMKLLFTISLTFHLFCLVVFMKNLTRLELPYVLLSTLFPLLISWIPFIHNNYGVAGAWCWIRDWKDDCATQHYLEGIIEQFTLWYGPLFVFMTVSVIAIVVIIIVMVWRVCREQQPASQPLLQNNDIIRRMHKEMLKELLSLLVYPTIYYCIYLFPLANRINNALTTVPSFKLTLLHSFFASSIGLFSSIILIIQVIVVKKYQQQTDLQQRTQNKTGDSAVMVSSTPSTGFSHRSESQVEKAYGSFR